MMDLKVIRKKVITIAIPLFLIAAITISLFLVASVGETVKYANITSDDYDLGSGDYDIVDAPACVYKGFLPVAQKGNLTMYVNSSSTAVAIYDSLTGRTLTSMIPEEELGIAKAQNADTTAYMRSNFVLKAVNMETGDTSDFNMFDSLQSNGKFKIEGIKDGVRITYLIGKIPETFTVPEGLSEKRYNEIMKELGDEAYIFENRYSLVDISFYYGEEKDEYLAKFPTCEDEKVYEFTGGEKKFIYEEIEELLSTIGYTEEQKEKDEKEVMADYEKEVYAVFSIPIEFKLNEDNFSVTVDREKILYSDAALPVSIEVCPFLMRAYSNEKGYMLMPDGSGSILNLNNGKTDLDSYMTKIYDEDPVFYENFSRVESHAAQLPVYGMKSDKGGVFAYISGCAEDAYVWGNISGKTSAANNAYTQFKIFGHKKELVVQDWTATGNGTIYNVRIQGKSISGKCTVKYYFMSPSRCEYSDMAALCRSIFTKEGLIKASSEANKNTALINLLGVYDYKKSFAGVPVTANKVMTTAKQATDIVNTLKDKGISADVRYLAAVNGGYKQTVPDGLNLASGIGSKKQFKELTSAVEGNGGKLYMELAFTKLYKNKTFDSFSRSKDAIAKINTEHTAFMDRDMLSFYYVKTPHYYIAPSLFKSNMNKVLKDAKKLGINGIAFRSFGETLYSDADEDNASTRTVVASRFSEAAEILKEDNVSMLYNGGGAYILKNAGYISNMASGSANYNISDGTVPFMQMVLHGSVPYTYETALNKADIKQFMLESIATGAKLQFDVSGNSSHELKATDYSNYYNTYWQDNQEKIAECCEFMNDAVTATAGKEFVSFERINASVTKSVFSDGVTVYVNYSDKDISVGEIIIKAQNYTLIK